MKILNLFSVFSSIIISTYARAAAQVPTNVCYFGGLPNGAIAHEFKLAEQAERLPRRYYGATLGENLTATVSLVQGHSAHYILIVSYKNGEVTLRDDFVDFQPNRLLSVQGAVKGEPLSCRFDPSTF